MIYDDMAESFGYPLPHTRSPVDQPTTMLPPYRPSPGPRPARAPAPQATPPPGCCPACGGRDPYALLHRHLDEAAGSLHARIHHALEAIMSALDNLTAELGQLRDSQSRAEAVLGQLADRSGGVPESDVQAAADQVTQLRQGLDAAVQTAAQQAGLDTSTSGTSETTAASAPA